jgi:hypothetical protein
MRESQAFPARKSANARGKKEESLQFDKFTHISIAHLPFEPDEVKKKMNFHHILSVCSDTKLMIDSVRRRRQGDAWVESNFPTRASIKSNKKRFSLLFLVPFDPFTKRN